MVTMNCFFTIAYDIVNVNCVKEKYIDAIEINSHTSTHATELSTMRSHKIGEKWISTQVSFVCVTVVNLIFTWW